MTSYIKANKVTKMITDKVSHFLNVSIVPSHRKIESCCSVVLFAFFVRFPAPSSLVQIRLHRWRSKLSFPTKLAPIQFSYGYTYYCVPCQCWQSLTDIFTKLNLNRALISAPQSLALEGDQLNFSLKYCDRQAMS